MVAIRDFERHGEIVMLKELLEGGDRALVLGRADEERVVRLASPLIGTQLRPGDSLLLEPRSQYVFERIPKSEVEELVLEEVPDIDYRDIGGLPGQIEQIRDAVELPYLHADLFREHKLAARRASCSTALPAAARRSSPRPSRTRWPRRWPRRPARERAGRTS